MPIYEFKCKDCGNKFEVLCSFNKLDSVCCENCNSSNIVRLMSTFGFSSSQKDGSSSRTGSSCDSCHSGKCSTCH